MSARLLLLTVLAGGAFAAATAVAACSSSDANSGASPSSDAGDAPETGGDDLDGSAEATVPPADPSSCNLPDVTGATPVAATFKIYDPQAGTVPATMTGGSVGGTYRVDKATVYLPNNVKGLAHPDTSTGTVTAWAVFQGKNYKLSVAYDFSIDSAIGPQAQTSEKHGAGTFSVDGPKISFDTACDPANAITNVELSFTDHGDGGVLVIKTSVDTPIVGPGDAYIELGAVKQP